MAEPLSDADQWQSGTFPRKWENASPIAMMEQPPWGDLSKAYVKYRDYAQTEILLIQSQARIAELERELAEGAKLLKEGLLIVEHLEANNDALIKAGDDILQKCNDIGYRAQWQAAKQQAKGR